MAQQLYEMRICHIQTRLLNGGADENTVLTCNHQVNIGHDVILLFGHETQPEIVAKIDPRVRTRQVFDLQRAINPLKDLRALNALRKELAELNPDIVHTHTSKAGILGRLAARLARCRHIVHGVHILPFLNVGKTQELVYKQIERSVSGFTDKFICVSQALADENIRHGIAPASKHVVVPSGMDVDRFRNASPVDVSSVLPEGNGREAPRIIVYVAALERRKRQIEFLDVLARIREELPETVVLYVGGGRAKQELENAILRKGLQRHAFVLGFRNDVERIIKCADVCILASEREGLARVLIQYCLVGKPIVSTSLPGIELVVKEGVNGYLAPVDDLPAMAAPIVELLRNDEKRDAFGRASRELDLSQWSAENMAHSIEAVYESLLRDR